MDGGGADQIILAEAPPARSLECRGFNIKLVSLPPGNFRGGGEDFHILSMVVGGSVRCWGRCAGNVSRWVQDDGDVEVIPAGAVGVWEDDDPVTMLEMRLSPGFLRDVAIGMERDPDRVELTHRFQLREPRIGHIARALKAELEADMPEERLYVESLGTALTTHLLRQYGVAAAPSRQGLSKRQRQRVVEYIDHHLDADLSLARLAAVIGIGTTHFQALFKQSMGLPVHQYVVRRRVEHARQLLLRGDRSIAEIALDSGFAHQSHLARWMQRLLGVTPAALLRGCDTGLLPVGTRPLAG